MGAFCSSMIGFAFADRSAMTAFADRSICSTFFSLDPFHDFAAVTRVHENNSIREKEFIGMFDTKLKNEEWMELNFCDSRFAI